MGRKLEKFGKCCLCRRETTLTSHHLIPRSRHRRRKNRPDKKVDLSATADLCRDCHSNVHMLYSEKELEEKYHTIELLRESPEVQKFTRWISKISHKNEEV